MTLLNPPSQLLGRANAILSTTSVPYVVEDFPGPLSIKWMAAGWGIWRTDSGFYRVDPGCYLVLNRGHVYSLSIDTKERRETFCPFFAAGFVEDAHAALTSRVPSLLDEPHGRAHPDATFSEHVRPSIRAARPCPRGGGLGCRGLPRCSSSAAVSLSSRS